MESNSESMTYIFKKDKHLDIKGPVIIIMKGSEFTGKTMVARAIANWLRCSLLCLDDILDGMMQTDRGHRRNRDSNLPSEKDEEPFYNGALNILFLMAISQVTTVKSSGTVVLDFSLSSQQQLDWLIQELPFNEDWSRIVIVECKRRSEYWSRLTYESISNFHSFDIHRLSRSWDEIQRKNIDQDTTSDQIRLGLYLNRCYISKLVLDPYVDTNLGVLFCDYLKRQEEDCELAIKHLVRRDWGAKPFVVELRQWEGVCRSYGHDICNYFDQRLDYKANCAACGCQISSGPAYSCKHCCLALHKHCAELSSRNKQSFKEVDMVYCEERFIYNFPTRHRCELCKEERKGFSHECGGCLFETHLKCSLMPTIIHCEPEPHFLHIDPLPSKLIFSGFNFDCAACGQEVDSTLGYVCKICNKRYHWQCMMQPPE